MITQTKHWATRWKDAGVPYWIIGAYMRDYVGMPPEWLTRLIEEDDQLCGLRPFTLGYREECGEHDFLHLLRRAGYPIESIGKTQGRFLWKTTKRGVVGAFEFVSWPVVGLIGAGVGAAIMIIDEVSK